MQIFFRPLPILMATLLWGLSSGQSGRALLVAGVLVWGCLRPIGWALTGPAQVLVALSVAMLIVVLHGIAPSASGYAGVEMDPVWAQVAEWSLTLAALRIHFGRPIFGQPGTLALGVLTFLACGTVRIGPLYPGLLGCFAVLSFVSLHREEHASDADRSSEIRMGRNSLVATALVSTALVLTLLLADAVPRFYSLAYSWAVQWVDDRQRAGFHDGPITLRSLDGLLQSDEVVLRVEGEAGERLRGNVYTHYARGRWLPAPRPREENIRFDWADPTIQAGREARAVIRYAIGGAGRYFIPSEGGRIALAPANARVDEMGIVRVAGRDPAERIAVFGKGDFPLAIHPPRGADLEVPEGLQALLKQRVVEWVSAEASPRQRVEAIRERLETDYSYSLNPPGSSDQEALVDFLTHTRQGHCEHFATAVVLLARAAGVPARLVTGYRIAEWNPFGAYAVVREKHAHAWAEMYVEELGWFSVDPSPLQSDGREIFAMTPWPEGLWDWALFSLQRRGLETLVVILILGLAAVQVARILRRERSPSRSPRPEFASPPPWLKDFLIALGRRGVTRARSESLESLARRLRVCARVAGSDQHDLNEAALLLRRYSALRYGQEGDEAVMREDFQRWMEEYPAAARDLFPRAPSP